MPAALDTASLHHAILRAIVDRGFAPTAEELAATFGVRRDEVSAGLRALHDQHGLVLHPGSSAIWIAHPFALAPTGIVVRKGARRWWSNCAWCGLGAASLLGGPAELLLNLGGEDRQACLRFDGSGELLDRDYVVHFPIPMARAWDNVVYTCSMMCLFDSVAAVDDWCRRHLAPRGDVRPIEQVLAFAREWYGRHLDRDWRKWTTAEAGLLFARHGLTGPIWSLTDATARF